MGLIWVFFWMSGVSLTQNTGHQAENDRNDHKGPVPVVRPRHRGYAQEDEDERVANAAPHLQEVLDCGVGLVGYVGLHVGAHHSTACDQTAGER